MLEQALLRSPQDESLKLKLAAEFLKISQLDRSAELLSEVLLDNPCSEEALWGMTKISMANKSYESARAYLSTLADLPGAKLNRDQALVYAKILARTSEFHEAAKWLDRAISCDSSLLQSELGLLKHIKSNLANDSEDTRESSPVSHQQTSQPNVRHLPNNLNKHYVVIEISQFDRVSSGGAADIADSHHSTEQDKLELSPHVRDAATFEQVGGLKRAKKELVQHLAIPLKNPEVANLYGLSVSPRVMLYGPSGCGKTLLAYALINEMGFNCLQLKPADFLDLTYEEAETKLAMILLHARESKPSVILIEDFDWMTSTGLESSYFRQNLLTSLLDMLDRDSVLCSQVALLVTTSKPWTVNHSFLATNKINYHVFAAPPRDYERAEILHVILQSHASPVLVPESIEPMKVVMALKDINTGADIANLVERCLGELLLEELIRMHKSESRKIVLTTEKLIATGRKIRSVPTIDIWMTDAKNYLKPRSSPLHHLWKQMIDCLGSTYSYE